jgi:hypothetical protein
MPAIPRSIANPPQGRAFPDGTNTETGQIAIIPWWTQMRFTYPNLGAITLNADQHSQTVTQTSNDPMPVWSPPYYVGSVFMTQDEIIALPSADAFFGELFTALDAKLALQMNPPPPPPPAPDPVP